MKEKNKHDHRATKCLKTIIFSILMLAPFLAVASKVAYTTLNKNAYQSYAGSYKYLATTNLYDVIKINNLETTSYTINEITNYYYDSNVLNNEYDGSLQILPNPTIVYGFNAKNLIINDISYGNKFITIDRTNWGTGYNVTLFNYTFNNEINYLTNEWQATPTLHENNTTISPSQRIGLNSTTSNKISFTIDDNKIFSNFNWDDAKLIKLNNINTNIFYVDTTLSSVFYSAVDELDDASIFSWTTNTMIYSSVTGMTEGLGIISPPLAVLITYWTILTSIYVIIDIVLEMFIFLTHWASDKL